LTVIRHRGGMLGTAILAAVVSTLTATIPATPEAQRALGSDLAQGVLGRRYLAVVVSETVAVPFEQVSALLSTRDALGRLLVAYVRSLPRPGEVTASLHREGAGTYRYLNEDGDPTEVRELYCGVGAEGGVEAILFARGRRSIGAYSSLIRVVAHEDGERTRFCLWLCVYPENALMRFAARTLGLAEHYFRSRSHEMCQMAQEVIPEAVRIPAAEVEASLGAAELRKEPASCSTAQQ